MMVAVEPPVDPVVALGDEIAGLDARLAGLADEQWRRPSWCDGWSVVDVVLHLAQTNEMAVASAKGRLDEHLASLTFAATDVGSVEDGAGALVAAERGAPAHQVHERWRASAQAMCAALAERRPSDRLRWVAGDLAARTLVTTRLAETWIHAGDIGWAFDGQPVATDRLWHIARLAWRTVPYAFAGAGRALAGPAAFELTGPAGERWDFGAEGAPATIVRGPALDLCLVAGRRRPAEDTALTAEGPDAAAVLELVRTFA